MLFYLTFLRQAGLVESLTDVIDRTQKINEILLTDLMGWGEGHRESLILNINKLDFTYFCRRIKISFGLFLLGY